MGDYSWDGRKERLNMTESFSQRMKSNLDNIKFGGIKDIHDQLATVIANEWNSIPESVFIQEFLDMFVNGVGQDLNRFNNWQVVVGNLRFGLHVLDDVTGDRLFTVPPIYDTSSLNPVPGDSDQESIAKHAAVYDSLLRARPQQAQQYFQLNMAKVMDKKFSSVMTENWKQYQLILERYNKVPKTSSGVKESGTTNLVYDDNDVL